MHPLAGRDNLSCAQQALVFIAGFAMVAGQKTGGRSHGKY